MRLLLIRHGETVDNVAGNYAGTTDSALTNHGVLQAERLGAHLALTGIKTACIFSSDLQRAFKTANAIRVAQSAVKQVIQLPELREQDFGFYEGKRFYERPKDPKTSGKDAHLAAHRDDPGFVDVESKESMTRRASIFVDQYLIDLIAVVKEDEAVVIVAHGIILNHLWRSVLRLFQPSKVRLATGVRGTDRGLEYLGGWSNTGYLDLEVKKFSGKVPVVIEVSSTPNPSPPAQSSGEEPKETPCALASKISPDLPKVPPLVVAQVEPLAGDAETSKWKLPHDLLIIHAVNSLVHLKGLKKTRGGIGSLKHDSSQKTMDSFFKKRKTE